MRYFGYDGLGSVRQMYDPTGTLTYAASYDPYGSPFEQFGPGGSLGFTGEHTDANGLQYLRARYYNPALGTFLSRDPVMGMVGGSSLTRRVQSRWSYALRSRICETSPIWYTAKQRVLTSA